MIARITAAAALAVAALSAFPQAAAAHGLVGRKDLPIPEWLFGWAAALVLVISFVALAVLWPHPRLERPGGRRVFRMPVAVDVICAAVGVALFAIVVYAGFAGSQTATANLTPTFVYVLFWVGLVPICALFGDVFRAFNPWLAVARAVAWAARRAGSGGAPEPLEYPERLGRWPAVIGLLAFVWAELAYSKGDDPSTLATLALVYAAVQLVGMSLYGVERWSRRGDAFGVYFEFFGRLSPLHRDGRDVRTRKPLSGLGELERLPGTVPLLCAMIGSTAFDGASEGPIWSDIAPDIASFFSDVGFGPTTSLELTFTVGLALGVLLVALVYLLGVLGMHTVGRRLPTRELARRFAHSLVPIAFAYVLAHYFSLLVYQGQATAYLASDPLGDGSDLFGTADSGIDYGVVSATDIWYVQVAALVVGHVAGLVLAHDRALVVYDGAREATRSQYWMLAVMVAFTTLGLYLLSSSNS